MQKIGIFAGTFDPIHQGHIAFAQAAVAECGLEKVYFLPERQPRSKQNVTDIATRIHGVKAAIQAHPLLDILILDEACFSVLHTLPKLQKNFPHASLTFLLGSDVVCGSLPYWQNLALLFPSSELAIGLRTSSSKQQVKNALGSLATPVKSTIIITPYSHIASSQLR